MVYFHLSTQKFTTAWLLEAGFIHELKIPECLTWSWQRSSIFSSASTAMSSSFSCSPAFSLLEELVVWDSLSKFMIFSYTCSITFLTWSISLADSRSLQKVNKDWQDITWGNYFLFPSYSIYKQTIKFCTYYNTERWTGSSKQNTVTQQLSIQRVAQRISEKQQDIWQTEFKKSNLIRLKIKPYSFQRKGISKRRTEDMEQEYAVLPALQKGNSKQINGSSSTTHTKSVELLFHKLSLMWRTQQRNQTFIEKTLGITANKW